MQSTNSEYGSPYLAVCHVTFTLSISVCTWASFTLILFPVTYVTASVTSSIVIINTFSQWRHPTYSVYFLAFPDYGFYSGPGDQRCAPCSFADYAALGPHTGQMLQSEHVTSTCNSPSQHHPSPDHFKSSGVYGMFCPRHVLLLTLVPSDVLGNTSSFFLIPNVHEYPSIWVHTLHAESCSPSFFCL